MSPVKNNVGLFSIAAGLIVLAVVTAVQAQNALSLWQQQVHNDAIDGCAQFAQYSSSRVREDENGEYTATDNYPIAWMFDECMDNKGEDYTRTDFSTIEEEQTTEETE